MKNKPDKAQGKTSSAKENATQHWLSSPGSAIQRLPQV